MKVETKAKLYIAKVVGTGLVGSVVAMLALTYIPINYIEIVLVDVGLGLILLTLYSMELDRLKILEKTREILKK